MRPHHQITPPETESNVPAATLEFPPLTATEERVLDELGASNAMTPSEVATKIGSSDAREAIWRLLAVGKIQLGQDLRLVRNAPPRQER